MKNWLKEAIAYAIVWLLFPVLTVVFGFGFLSLGGVKDYELEQCLPVVVASQIEITAEAEFIKAQSILTRSSLYKAMKEDGLSLLELQSWCQEQLKYRDLTFASFYKRVVKACRDTSGQKIWYKDQVCMGAFFAQGKGSTRDGFTVFQNQDYAYLSAVAVPSQAESQIFYYTEEELTTTLERWYGESMEELQTLAGQLSIYEKDQAGYVMQVQLGNTYISGSQFAHDLQLSSPCFEIEETENQWRITCYGKGHGFGMDQSFAERLAKDGYGYEEIINYFFPQVEIRK